MGATLTARYLEVTNAVRARVRLKTTLSLKRMCTGTSAPCTARAARAGLRAPASHIRETHTLQHCLHRVRTSPLVARPLQPHPRKPTSISTLRLEGAHTEPQGARPRSWPVSLTGSAVAVPLLARVPCCHIPCCHLHSLHMTHIPKPTTHAYAPGPSLPTRPSCTRIKEGLRHIGRSLHAFGRGMAQTGGNRERQRRSGHHRQDWQRKCQRPW